MWIRRWQITVLIAAGVISASCSSSTSDDTTSTSAPTTTAEVATTVASTVTTTSTTTTVPSLVVEDLVDARNAIVRVKSEGSFTDPTDLEISPAGTGTGFLLSEDGLAVTTGRAVIGADSIGVFFGDAPDAVPATLVAYDECSNLALIDIAGDGFPYLDLETDPAFVGTVVYVPETRPSGAFALREGIVSDEDPGGITSWASIDAFVEHTAAASISSSGAPLLTEEGRVLGVNHIGDSLDRYFAIPSEHVRALQKTGTGPGIGINGVAVKNDDYNGTWTAQVAPGSPAAELGVQPGDVVTFIGDVEMASGGGQGNYCATVTDKAFDESSTIKVYRTTPPQNYVGTLNSGEAMERTFKPSRDLAYHLPAMPDEPHEFVWIERDDGTLGMSVPTAWGDVDSGDWVRGTEDDRQEIGIYLHGVVDWDLWSNGWSTPGIWMSSSASLADEYEGYSYLDRNAERSADSACTYDGRFRITENAPVPIVFDVWHDCGEDGSSFIETIFETAPGESMTMLQTVLVSQRDIEAFGRATGTAVFPGSD